ncbi:MAG TPA: hypothetical protein VMH04_20970 [Candidatus Solibacter sp.]|nr:hypothetical protein [Candidatus Solibacter sp.]
MFRLRSCHIVFLILSTCLAVSRCAAGQNLYVDQEARVNDLPSLQSRTHDPADVLRTALDMMVHDHEVCCGRDSALEDSLERADPSSLKDVAEKLQGHHLLSDGRPIQVTAEFLPTDSVGAFNLVNPFNNKHAVLMMWNSHIYVLRGVIYRWVDNSPDGPSYTVIRKMQMIDPRYADARREVEFNRETDDPAKVQGFLFLTFAPQ